MSFVREFREFALKGSVIDLAVGVIIGAGFNKIVDSLVNDLVMPVVGRFTGGLEFANYFTPLGPVPAGLPHTLDAMKKAGVPVIAWGNFANVALNFVILAFIVFMMVKQINRLRRQEPAAAAPPENTLLLREIRDSLKK
jgi:large conductance mechanosensitive channel